MAIHSSVLELIGDTPIVQARRLDTGLCTLYLKLESANPGGSIKDRIGMSMIEAAEKRGDLKPGATLVEGTAGDSGIGLALVAAPLTLWRWDAPDVTLVLSLALIGACAVATGVAIVLPWMISRFGGDPALGSGPLATVIQDLLSILIYLGIAAAVLH